MSEPIRLTSDEERALEEYRGQRDAGKLRLESEAQEWERLQKMANAAWGRKSETWTPEETAAVGKVANRILKETY